VKLIFALFIALSFSPNIFADPTSISAIPKDSTVTFQSGFLIPANSSVFSKDISMGSYNTTCYFIIGSSSPYDRTIAAGQSFSVVQAFSKDADHGSYETQGIKLGREGQSEIELSCINGTYSTVSFSQFQSLLAEWLNATIVLSPPQRF
jgi:hypothetical protein